MRFFIRQINTAIAFITLIIFVAVVSLGFSIDIVLADNSTAAIVWFADEGSDFGSSVSTSFTDIDVTDSATHTVSVPNDAAGVIVRVWSNTLCCTNYKIRENGSSDDLNRNLRQGEQIYEFVGMAGDGIVEFSKDNVGIHFALAGYMRPDFIVVFDNLVNKGTGSSWADIDITANIGTDAGNVEAAIVGVYSTASCGKSVCPSFGLRKNGSTATLTSSIRPNNMRYWIVGVDSNDIFEANFSDSGITARLLGYIRKGSGYNAILNPADEELTTIDAWTTASFTDATSANTNGIIGLMNLTATVGELADIRNVGSSDVIRGPDAFSIVGAATNTSQQIQYYIDSTDVDFYIIGYTETQPALLVTIRIKGETIKIKAETIKVKVGTQ